MIFKFSEVFEDVTKFSKKTKKKDYLSDGKIAIIDQSKSHIAGYTNDRNKTYKGKLPAIIFGDHTRNLKYIDFDFSLGADGTKILVGKNNLDNKYLFFNLKSKEISDLGYSRHFKVLKKEKFKLHDSYETKKIISYLDIFEDLIKLKMQQKEILKNLNIKIFNEKIYNLKKNDFLYNDIIQKFVKIDYGKSLPETKRKPGKFNVYGSNGVIGSHSLYLFNKNSIIIGRKGSAGKLHYVESPFFPIDTTFYVSKFDNQKIRLKFLFFYLDSLNLSNLILPQGVPGLRRNDIYKLKIKLPSLDIQDQLINKLDQNEKINFQIEKSINQIKIFYKNELFKIFN